MMLATYLTGLVLGSFLYARFADRTRNPWLIFGWLVTGAGASALLIFASMGPARIAAHAGHDRQGGLWSRRQ